jgi:hypothetical protein
VITASVLRSCRLNVFLKRIKSIVFALPKEFLKNVFIGQQQKKTHATAAKRDRAQSA